MQLDGGLQLNWDIHAPILRGSLILRLAENFENSFVSIFIFKETVPNVLGIQTLLTYPV